MVQAILEAWEGNNKNNANWKSAEVRSASSDLSHHLLLFSASNSKSLGLQQDAIDQYIAEKQPDLADLAYTLGCRRTKLSYRSFRIAGHDGTEPVEIRGTDLTSTKERSVVFMFNGQGASWPSMGCALIETSPVFRRCIRRLDGALHKLPNPPSWTIEGP